MFWESAQQGDHFPVGSEDDADWFLFVIDEDAKKVFEKGVGIERGVHFEGSFCFFEFDDSVEGIDAEFVGVLVAFNEEVPALAEHFEAIRFDGNGFWGRGIKALVRHFERHIVFDGFDDGLQVFQSFGDFFQNESVFNGKAVDEDVVDGEGLEHPVLGRVVFECFWVADEVLVLVVAFYPDAEHVVDGLSDAVEGGSGEGFAVVEVIVDP